MFSFSTISPDDAAAVATYLLLRAPNLIYALKQLHPHGWNMNRKFIFHTIHSPSSPVPPFGGPQSTLHTICPYR